MADWYYYNESGEKIGPISGKELKQLVRDGTVTPETRLEDSEGRAAAAGNVKGLTFPEMAQSQPDPFTIAPPPTTNPFGITPLPYVPPHQQAAAGTVPLGYQTAGEPLSGAKSPGILDIQFTRFITNVWISAIWVIIIGTHFLTYLCVIFGMLISVGMAQRGGDDAFAEAIMMSLVLFLLVTVGLVLSLLFWRMTLELIIVIFRIESNTRPIKERTESNVAF
ncbi:MAG: DUF4282 domain-containing protein [Planctomycetaceae bacterium]|nr:DUF4282 domain-containing protein [Planctomycetaceae bacterium]